MKRTNRFQRFICALAICGVSLLLPASADAPQATALDGNSCLKDCTGFYYHAALFDNNRQSVSTSQGSASLTLENPNGIGSLYLIFDRECGAFTLVNNDSQQSAPVGQEGFLHTYLSTEEIFGITPTSVTLRFEGSTSIAELSVYTPGQVPDAVQRWEVPVAGGTDLVLFSTHADDEQLFFAGILPYYAGQLQYRVQVVYLSDHHNLPDIPNPRRHEALDGLWSVGVRTYPVFGPFADYYTHSAQDCYSLFRFAGISEDDLLSFVVEQIRRFRPQVGIGHDLKGEYGHGEHMLYADLLTKAVLLTDDPSYHPASAQQWGTWQLPKLYLHLYEENPIVMDWDQPLSNFGGMTAYQVTKTLGFPCHRSQQTSFNWYMNDYHTASEIPKYSPCNYGLYWSTVGEDLQKNDFFENIK